MSRPATNSRSILALALIVFAMLAALAPAVDAAPRQPSTSQKGQNHKEECADLGGSFESGTYADADTGKVTNYSVCFTGNSMVICEWTATTDACHWASPGAIQPHDRQTPATDDRFPPAPTPPGMPGSRN